MNDVRRAETLRQDLKRFKEILTATSFFPLFLQTLHIPAERGVYSRTRSSEDEHENTKDKFTHDQNLIGWT